MGLFLSATNYHGDQRGLWYGVRTVVPSQLAGVALALVTSVLLARGLGPVGRGAYALITLAAGVLASVGNVGISVSTAYHVALPREDKGETVGAALVIAGANTVAIWVVSFSLWRILAALGCRQAQEISWGTFGSIALLIPLLLVYGYMNSALLARSSWIGYNLPNFSVHGVTAVGLAIGYVWQGELTVTLALAVYIMAVALTAGLMLFLVARDIPPVWPKKSKVRELLAYGVRVWPGELAAMANYRLDSFVVASFLGAGAVGQYAVAQNLSERLWLVPGVVGTLLLPRIASRPGSSWAQTAYLARLSLALTVFLAAILAAVRVPLVDLLFGAGFRQGADALLLLLPGVIAISLSHVLRGDFSGRGNPGLFSWASATGLVVMLGLDLLLVPQVGLNGAALASTVGYTSQVLVLLAGFTRSSHLHPGDVLLPRVDDVLGWLRRAGSSSEGMGS